jgi:hypothetical protein
MDHLNILPRTRPPLVCSVACCFGPPALQIPQRRSAENPVPWEHSGFPREHSDTGDTGSVPSSKRCVPFCVSLPALLACFPQPPHKSEGQSKKGLPARGRPAKQQQQRRRRQAAEDSGEGGIACALTRPSARSGSARCGLSLRRWRFFLAAASVLSPRRRRRCGGSQRRKAEAPGVWDGVGSHLCIRSESSHPMLACRTAPLHAGPPTVASLRLAGGSDLRCSSASACCHCIFCISAFRL